MVAIVSLGGLILIGLLTVAAFVLIRDNLEATSNARKSAELARESEAKLYGAVDLIARTSVDPDARLMAENALSAHKKFFG